MKAALNDPNNWTLWKCIKEGDGTEEQRNLPLTFQLNLDNKMCNFDVDLEDK